MANELETTKWLPHYALALLDSGIEDPLEIRLRLQSLAGDLKARRMLADLLLIRQDSDGEVIMRGLRERRKVHAPGATCLNLNNNNNCKLILSVRAKVILPTHDPRGRRYSFGPAYHNDDRQNVADIGVTDCRWCMGFAWRAMRLSGCDPLDCPLWE